MPSNPRTRTSAARSPRIRQPQRSTPPLPPRHQNPRITGKICITTTFDRNYIPAGQTLFKSIRHHTDCSGIDFKVITADPEVVAALGAENCHVITAEIAGRYADVKYFRDLPREKYYQSWYRYEIFGMTDYDRVLCIDSDCLCLEDISYLFSEELSQYDLISVQDYIVSDLWLLHLMPELEAQGLNFEGLYRRRQEGIIDIQPALLVANRSAMKWYDRLLQYANTAPFAYSIDQGILNNFIYENGWKIKLLPLEWDYQDLYEVLIPHLRVPANPIIVHCQQSKPFKNDRDRLDPRLQKRYDQWWAEAKRAEGKTIVAIIIWNRYENLELWLRCWAACDHAGSELVIVHNLETDNARYEQLCQEYHVRYVPRANKGFDIGALQDVCRDRLAGFPADWDNLIWITDDCIPMTKDFVVRYLADLQKGYLPCYEISDAVKRHVRTTGFSITHDLARQIVFPNDPIRSREDCYQFEHKGFNFYEQLVKLGAAPRMLTPDIKSALLWDAGFWTQFKETLMPRHQQIFPPPASAPTVPKATSLLDGLAIKHQADKSSLVHNFAEKYDRMLAARREQITSMLEIGVGCAQSMKMWTDYFPNATIHGADIASAAQFGVDIDASIKICKAYSNRIQIHLTDQRDRAQLKNLEQFGPFDLVIDDGSHFWAEQILTFETLFDYVKPGGLYVVEDSCTSYWPEYKNHPVSCVDYFKGLVDDVNFRGARGRVPANPPMEFPWNMGWHRREDCQAMLPAFESIQFMNSLIIVTKR